MDESTQYCPVAMATEILGDRWTPLILRELIVGAHSFSGLLAQAPRGCGFIEALEAVGAGCCRGHGFGCRAEEGGVGVGRLVDVARDGGFRGLGGAVGGGVNAGGGSGNGSGNGNGNGKLILEIFLHNN